MTTVNLDLDNTTIRLIEQMAKGSKLTVSEWISNIAQRYAKESELVVDTPSIADSFASLRDLLNENEEMMMVERSNRPNEFMEHLDAH